jgi:signal peptidase I
VAFIDHGRPDLNQEAFGLKIPENQYLVLGDNHAMSADSRVFGFVPQANLQGVPEFIFWPVGDRIGRPDQKPYPTFVTPRMIVWALAALTALVSYLIYCYRLRRPLQLKNSPLSPLKN